MNIKQILPFRKGMAEISELQALVTALVLIGIIAGIGVMVLEKFQDKMAVNSSARAGVNETINAMKEIPTWLPIIIIVAIAGIILTLVFKAIPGAGGGTSGY